MITLGISRDIPRPASTIWPVMGTFSRLPEWFPGIDAFQCSGDAPGSRRDITIGAFLVTQELLSQDEAGQKTVYQVISGPGISRETGFVVTIIVTALGNDSCRVDWHATLEQLPSMFPPGSEGAFVARTEGNYKAAMDAYLNKLGEATS